MKKAIVRKWVKALRSGKYKQGRYQLHWPSDNTFCCLGVLNDVCGLGASAAAGYLPPVVEEELGMEEKLRTTLTEMNDTDNRSFKYIASYLERKFLKATKKK